MGMMFGFGTRRRHELEAELRRMAAELPRLGVERAYLAGDLADSRVDIESDLELVLVHETTEPFHRRADFFTAHLRPRVGTRFFVYTPDEFERDAEEDPLLLRIVREGQGVDDA